MRRLSVSSLKTYLTCPQKWKLKYVDRLPEEPKPFFNLGSAVHTALETFYDGRLTEPLPWRRSSKRSRRSSTRRPIPPRRSASAANGTAARWSEPPTTSTPGTSSRPSTPRSGSASRSRACPSPASWTGSTRWTARSAGSWTTRQAGPSTSSGSRRTGSLPSCKWCDLQPHYPAFADGHPEYWQQEPAPPASTHEEAALLADRYGELKAKKSDLRSELDENRSRLKGFFEEKGEPALPENEGAAPTNVVRLRDGLWEDQVREGRF